MDDASVRAVPGWPLTPAEEELIAAAESIAAAVEAGLEAAPGASVGHARADEPPLIATFHVVRALRCLHAVTLTCRAGYAVEAAPIVRSMLEDAISLRYLSLRPEAGARKWIRFDEARSLEYWRMSERLGLGWPKSEHIRQLESAPAPSGHPVWWSGKTPSAMARELKRVDQDLHQTFKALYPWLSDVAHANVKTTSNYYFAEGAREPALQVGPSNHLLHLMVDLAAGVCVKICLIARDMGAQMDASEVLDLKSEFDEVSDTISDD